MRKRLAGARGVLVVICVLAALIALGRNHAITWSLVASVITYLGYDLAVLHKFRIGGEDA